VGRPQGRPYISPDRAHTFLLVCGGDGGRVSRRHGAAFVTAVTINRAQGHSLLLSRFEILGLDVEPGLRIGI